MKKLIFIPTLFSCIFLLNCKKENPEPEKPVAVAPASQDSLTDSKSPEEEIRKAFSQLGSQPQFLKDIDLQDDPQAKLYTEKSKIIQGDLDGDKIADALVSFSVEGRNGGNNSDAHYAVLLSKNGQWKYGGQLDAAAGSPEEVVDFTSIKDGQILGNIINLQDQSIPEIPVKYLYQNGNFLNIYTALHEIENPDPGNQMKMWPNIEILAVMTPDFKTVPMESTVKKIEQILGKGNLYQPKDPLECGTYWDEGPLRYLEYPKFKFEVNPKNQTAWTALRFINSPPSLQTNWGTINQETTLSEVKKVFKKYKQVIEADDNGGQHLNISIGGFENSLVVFFDKNGKILRAEQFFMC